MVLLALLGTMVFKVPPNSGEKIGYCLTVMLSYTVYLTVVSQTMPSASHTTSIVGKIVEICNTDNSTSLSYNVYSW